MTLSTKIDVFYGFYICSQWAFIHALLSRVPFALAGLSCTTLVAALMYAVITWHAVCNTQYAIVFCHSQCQSSFATLRTSSVRRVLVVSFPHSVAFLNSVLWTCCRLSICRWCCTTNLQQVETRGAWAQVWRIFCHFYSALFYVVIKSNRSRRRPSPVVLKG